MLPLHFLQRVQGWPIFMSFLRHKAKLSLRPISSATGTYNLNLASVNEYTITDVFEFAVEIGKHLLDTHGDKTLLDESQFCAL